MIITDREELCREITIEQVANIFGPIKKRGSYYYSDCPNPDCHSSKDKTLAISPKGYAKCYKCGWYAFDSVHYYAQRCNIGEAKEKLEKMFCVSEGDGTKIKPKDIVSVPEKEKAPAEILDMIYRKFCNSSEFIGEEILNEKDHNYLLGRGLSEIVIQKNGYVSMPSRAVMPKFTEELEKEGLLDYLGRTPGFFYREAFGDWNFTYINAIVIPMKNEFGQIIALQLRKRVLINEDDLRYCWFSSANLDEVIPNYKGYTKGTSSKAPLSVYYAYHINKETKEIVEKAKVNFIAITEGAFKAEMLASKGIDTISIQGVNSFKAEDIIDCVENISEIKNVNYRNICIFYDADMKYNVNVVKAIISVATVLRTKYNIFVAQWDVEKGKGIDDYIMNGNELSSVKIVKYYIFLELAEKFIDYVKSNAIKEKEEMKKVYYEIAKEYDL